MYLYDLEIVRLFHRVSNLENKNITIVIPNHSLYEMRGFTSRAVRPSFQVRKLCFLTWNDGLTLLFLKGIGRFSIYGYRHPER